MEYNYYCAVIRSAGFGPRRELTLDVETRGPQNTATEKSGAHRIIVRFGGIANYEEVVEAFRHAKTDESLHYIRDTVASRPSSRVIEIGFDRTEQAIHIVCRHVREQCRPPLQKQVAVI